MKNERIISHTQNWIASMVIGLNLCPFAERGFNEKTIRYVVTENDQVSSLSELLKSELALLAASPPTEILTTLLIHPAVLQDFLQYNEFLANARRALKKQNLEGVIQLVGFHPEYEFQDTDSHAAENYTNRSPYPMIHLLREASVSEVATNPEALLDIPRRNIEVLRGLGTEVILRRLKGCIPL